MIYAVSGMPRCGTSMMMHLVGECGIPRFFCEEREAQLMELHDRNHNPYYYEHKQVMSGHDLDTVPGGHVVKLFAPALYHLETIIEARVVFMYRAASWHEHYMPLLSHALSNYDTLFMDYDDLIDEPKRHCQRLVDFIGFGDASEIAAHIETDRRHRPRKIKAKVARMNRKHNEEFPRRK